MRLETRGSLQFSGDSRLEALESSLLGPRTQGLCPWVLGAAGDCPGVVSEVVSEVPAWERWRVPEKRLGPWERWRVPEKRLGPWERWRVPEKRLGS